MGFGTIEQLIARGQPSPITSALQGFQTGAQIMPTIKMAQLAPALRQAQTQLAQAQAQKALAIAKDPFLGKILPGQAGKVQGQELIKQMYGANSPQALDAEHGRNIELNLQKARGDYYGANVQFKYLPQNVKNQRILVYQKDMANRQRLGHPVMTFQDWLTTHYPPAGDGLVHSNQPTTETPGLGAVTPASPTTISTDKAVPNYAQMAEQTAGVISKTAGDAKIRQRATAANNVLKILNDEDVDNISKFAGLEGKMRYLYQAGKANIGITPSKDYLDYRLFKKSQAKAIADAARLILQTSQRGSYVYRMLQPLADPTMETWGNSPEEVKMRLNFMKHFMADYSNNLSKQALTGFTPSLVHQEQTGMLQGATAGIAAQPTTGTIRVRSPDGKTGHIPAANLDEALKQGFKRI